MTENKKVEVFHILKDAQSNTEQLLMKIVFALNLEISHKNALRKTGISKIKSEDLTIFTFYVFSICF